MINQLENHSSINRAIINKIEKSEEKRAAIDEKIDFVEDNLSTNPALGNAQLNLIRQYKVLLSENPAISIQPFFLHIIMYFWPIMYTGLGSLIFIIKPNKFRNYAFVEQPLAAAAVAAGVFALNIAPLLFRTLVAKSENRTVFAYTNPDIGPASFAMQMFNFAIFGCLIAMVWLEWSRWSEFKYNQLNEASEQTASMTFTNLESLSSALLCCQMSILVISPGFITYTGIFWTQLIKNHDLRFGYEAIAVHVVWLITVIFLSLPLILEWRAWQRKKLAALAFLISLNEPAEVIAPRMAALESIRPIGTWNITASSFALLTSFAVPLIQAMLR